MDKATQVPPKFTLLGFVLAIAGGAIATGVVGYGHYFIANVIGFDLIILLPIFMGFAIGWLVGAAARLGRLRSSLVVILVGLIFGLAGYGARYVFEFNALIDAVVEEHTLSGGSPDETRAEFLEFWAEEYPPGGFVGYLRHVAETGFTLSDDLFGDEGTGTPAQGPLVWVTFALEASLASVMCAGLARATAIGPMDQPRRKYYPKRRPTTGPHQHKKPD